jgi:hypothetical protein
MTAARRLAADAACSSVGMARPKTAPTAASRPKRHPPNHAGFQDSRRAHDDANEGL